MLVGEALAGLLDEVVHQARGRFGLRRSRPRAASGGTPSRCGSVSASRRRGRRRAGRGGSGARAPARTKSSTPGSAMVAQVVAEGGAGLGADAAGAAVGDEAAVRRRCRSCRGRPRPRAEVEVDAQRLEDAAPDAILERVVAEEGEVAGPAAGRDAEARLGP